MTFDSHDGARSASPLAIAEHWLRKVEFERLPRAVQDRFVASTAERFPPWPILRAHPRPPASRGWTLACVAALVVLVALFAAGFGDPRSSLLTRPSWMVVVFTGLVAAALLGLLRALAARGAHDLPFRAGIYLFPSEVVDARSPTLRIHPLGEMSALRVDARAVSVTFRDGAEFRFRVSDRAAGEAAAGQVLRARDAVEMSHDAPELLGLVDPLWESGAPPPATNPPFQVRWSFWVERSVAVALAGGLALGPPLHLLREWASDELAYRRATGDEAALTAYERHGRRHVAEVREGVLPLLTLRALTTTHEIDRWTVHNPAIAASPEARTVRRAALLRDLDALADIPAIRAFSRIHRVEGFEREIDAALARAHRAMTARRVGSLVFAHVLVAPRDCGATLGVVVRSGASDLRGADRAVASSPRFAGTVSFPTRYLGAHAEAERAARASIVQRVDGAFPEGCLRVDASVPRADESASLELTWSPRFAGTLLESSAPPAVFADLSIDVVARVRAADGRELAILRRAYPASVPRAALSSFAHLARRDCKDDAIERQAYEDAVARSLDLAARDVATWLLGREPEALVSPL